MSSLPFPLCCGFSSTDLMGINVLSDFNSLRPFCAVGSATWENGPRNRVSKRFSPNTSPTKLKQGRPLRFLYTRHNTENINKINLDEYIPINSSPRKGFKLLIYFTKDCKSFLLDVVLIWTIKITLRFGVIFIKKDSFCDSKDFEDFKVPYGGQDDSGLFVFRSFKEIGIAFDPTTVSNKDNCSTFFWDCKLAIMSNSIKAFLALPLLIATSFANLVVNVWFQILTEVEEFLNACWLVLITARSSIICSVDALALMAL